MDDVRLPTHVWLKAGIRRCFSAGIPAVVVRHGDDDRGTVLLKINRMSDQCRVLSQVRDLDGQLGWFAAFDGADVPETDADAHIDRAVTRDPDIWVVEVEDPEGRNPFSDGML